jgi:transcriptional regulator with XRE-family HTH domain
MRARFTCKPYRISGHHKGGAVDKLSVAEVKAIQERLRTAVQKLGGVRKTETETGIAHSTISAWLTKVTRASAVAWRGPGVPALRRLAQATGYSTDWLLSFDVPRDLAARELVTPELSLTQLRLALHAYLIREMAKDKGIRIHEKTIQLLFADPDRWLKGTATEFVMGALELEMARSARRARRRKAAERKSRQWTISS